jgi:hypothetical protein
MSGALAAEHQDVSQTLLQGLLLCLALVISGCRSADVNDSDASRPRRHEQNANKQGPPQSSWRACRRDADCETDHVCVTVDPRLEPAISLAGPLAPKLCARVAPPNLALKDMDLERGYLERLVVFPKVKLTLGPTSCTAKACFDLNGAPAACCNRCDGEEVSLPGFVGVPLIQPGGERLECEDRMDCEPPSCPIGIRLDKDWRIAGVFHLVDGRLTFLLATDPERWIDPY